MVVDFIYILVYDVVVEFVVGVEKGEFIGNFCVIGLDGFEFEVEGVEYGRCYVGGKV